MQMLDVGLNNFLSYMCPHVAQKSIIYDMIQSPFLERLANSS